MQLFIGLLSLFSLKRRERQEDKRNSVVYPHKQIFKNSQLQVDISKLFAFLLLTLLWKRDFLQNYDDHLVFNGVKFQLRTGIVLLKKR